jgi:hypothetical protein
MALRAAKCQEDAHLPCNEINGLQGVFNGAVVPGKRYSAAKTR